MKFDPKPAPARSSTEAPGAMTAEFTLDHGPFANQSFSVRFVVCPNPCCPCAMIGCECQREEAPGQTLRFDLDLPERKLHSQVRLTGDALALGRAFVSEAQPAQWEWLERVFIAAKQDQMRRMDLDTLDARLPSDVMAGKASMVGYWEVFPWADALAFSLGGVKWCADDMYCADPECPCTEAALSFFTGLEDTLASRQAWRHRAFVRYNYTTDKVVAADVQPGAPAADVLLSALREANANLAETFRSRHKQLKQIARRLLPKSRPISAPRPWDLDAVDSDDIAGESLAPPPTPARSQPRPGRNEPCPCGSGKKYKKCCGAN